MAKVSLYKQICIKNKITQKQLAAELGVSSRTVTQWSMGKATPKRPNHIAAVKRVFKKYGVDYEVPGTPNLTEDAPLTESVPKEDVKKRTRNIISVNRLSERIERFERVRAPEQEALWLREAITYAAAEFGMKPVELREATAVVLGTLRGRVPLTNVLTLLTGTEL